MADERERYGIAKSEDAQDGSCEVCKGITSTVHSLDVVLLQEGVDSLQTRISTYARQ